MSEEREFLRGNTPILILAVLSDGPHHGYAVAREVNLRSGNTLSLRQGALYPALHALERDGLIDGNWEEAGERSRKVYSITDAGRAELQRRTQVWSKLSSALNNVLGGEPGEELA